MIHSILKYVFLMGVSSAVLYGIEPERHFTQIYSYSDPNVTLGGY